MMNQNDPINNNNHSNHKIKIEISTSSCSSSFHLSHSSEPLIHSPNIPNISHINMNQWTQRCKNSLIVK